jgi:RNA polymerase sigma-70 factor (ECF subfamily)
MRDPDPRTVQQARAGDLRAFEELVRLYQAEVFRFAWHLTRDRSLAEDITQETFLRAFRFINGYRGTQRFGSWLFAIARNCSMDALRKRGTIAEHDGREARATPDASTRAELDAALAAVSAEHRDAFLLVEVFGLSYQEAADVLGVAVGTVKSRMFRARRALCAAIAIDDEDAR